MVTTKAIYYDGISSVSQQVDLLLDEVNASLCFYTTGVELKNWPIGDISFHGVGSMTEIHLGMEILRVDDPGFVKNVKRMRKAQGHTDLYHRLIDLGWKVHLLIAGGILALIALFYLYAIPWGAEKAVSVLPDSYDNQLGNMFFEKYILPDEIDTAKTVELRKFASLIHFHNHRPLKFTVIRSEIVNAYALPDGNIVVYTGLLGVMKDYDELAGVLAHEAMHVNNRHSMKMLARNLSGYLFLSAVMSDVNGIMAIIVQNLHTLESLTYSREFEQEADMEGVKLLIDNHINPDGMSKLLSHLEKESGGFVPEILSSHPITSERVSYVKKMEKELSYRSEDHLQMKQIFLELKK